MEQPPIEEQKNHWDAETTSQEDSREWKSSGRQINTAKISQQIIVSKTQGTGTFLSVVRKGHTNWQINSQRKTAVRVMWQIV